MNGKPVRIGCDDEQRLSNKLSNHRLSAQELMESAFLAVEPDVQLLATDASHKLLTLQVVFKGSDKVSVKFEFNVVCTPLVGERRHERRYLES